MEEALTLTGPAGALEAVLSLPTTAHPTAMALVCHPHPLHAGTMHNKVVHTLARTFVGRGMAALRFNFRGVGKSAGVYDEGLGETEDALAAARYLAGRFDNLPLWLAGFSFGSLVALRASAALECAGVVLIAPPVNRLALAGLESPRCPWLIVQGDADELVDAGAVAAWADRVVPSPTLVLLPGVGHFFHGQLNQLRESVSKFVDHA